MNNILKWVLYIVFWPISLSIYGYHQVLTRFWKTSQYPRLFSVFTILNGWLILLAILSVSNMVAMLTTLFLFILLESLITLILNIKNKRSLKRPLITLISSLILIFSFAQFGPDEPTTKTEPKADHIVYKPAKSDQKEYVAAKTKKAALIATLAKLKNENAELKSAKNDGDQKVKKQEQQKKEAESKRLAQKAEEASAKEAAEKQAKQAASQSKKVASSQSRAIASSAREQSKQAASSSASDSGDTYTGNAQSIIGNANSKIYHVPGQSGYHMNSSNAVYFKSEADAQAHGYRKALR